MSESVRLTAWVHGRVQGVGFRFWTQEQAVRLGLAGSATNLPDGTVEVIAEGPREACADLLAALRGPMTPGRVRRVVERWGNAQGAGARFVTR